MVPQYQPEVALTMITEFLADNVRGEPIAIV